MAPDRGPARLHGLLLPVGVVVVAAVVWLWAILQPAEISRQQSPRHATGEVDAPDAPAGVGADAFAEVRNSMVERQLAGRDITDRRVLSAMRRIPRHEFVSEELQDQAYSDRPLPIEHNQTISQPYIVALMTQLARPRGDARVLDIGTGTGYQAAVLAELVEKVYSIEIVCPLADSARERLKRLGYTDIEVICGDGYRGLPDKAPFDLIIVAAAPDHVPQPLVEQLAPGGRLVIPVGRSYQNLLVIEKLPDGTVREENIAPVAFVPMTGEAQEKRD